MSSKNDYIDSISWTPKKKKWYQYEIKQKSGGLRSFYFPTAMKLNVFRNKTREHSSEYIMPDKTNVVSGLRETSFAVYIDIKYPYAPSLTDLEYYACEEDSVFWSSKKWWDQARDNVEKKRREGLLPPKGVNQTDWVKMSQNKKKKTTEEYYGKK